LPLQSRNYTLSSGGLNPPLPLVLILPAPDPLFLFRYFSADRLPIVFVSFNVQTPRLASIASFEGSRKQRRAVRFSRLFVWRSGGQRPYSPQPHGFRFSLFLASFPGVQDSHEAGMKIWIPTIICVLQFSFSLTTNFPLFLAVVLLIPLITWFVSSLCRLLTAKPFSWRPCLANSRKGFG